MKMLRWLGASLSMLCAAVGAQSLPSYYPADYAKMVEASKAEPGVLVYSIMSAQNWKPVIESFAKKYPWIKVETTDLSNELFARYYSERAANTRTADLVASFGIPNWLEFTGKGEALVYESPEAPRVPAWSRPFPGVYTISADPVLIVWNKNIVKDKRLTTMAEVAELAGDPKLAGKFCTYDTASGAVIQTFHWVWGQMHGERGWKMLERVGPVSKVERSGGQMLTKLISGEYGVVYLTSAITVFPKLNDPGVKGNLEWSFVMDGQPLYPRAMAVTKGARSPNSAKLLLDHILSTEGQIGFGKGGLTPIRDDIKDADVPFYTYRGVIKAVGGESNVRVMGYDRNFTADTDAYLARWKAAYKPR
jgi:iron(III) transport system substrate-binding protein